MVFSQNRPLKVVLRWQVLVTTGVAAAAAILGSTNAALSAICGGAVSIVGGIAFQFFARPARIQTAGTALLSVLRAEAVKVLVIVALLWLAMTLYKDMVPTIFIATFMLAVLIQSMAFFVRDKN
ncbi:MAG: ATP synthase subunit I [Burkholderiales bacterium]